MGECVGVAGGLVSGCGRRVGECVGVAGGWVSVWVWQAGGLVAVKGINEVVQILDCSRPN